MHTQHDGMQETLSSSKTRLDKLHAEITQTTDKIKSREKFLNNQLDPILKEYRSVQVLLSFPISLRNAFITFI